MSIQSISDQVTPKQLFLIDALGALVSATLLGVTFILLDHLFGTLPERTLYVLIFIPCVFALYSFFCFLRLPKNWQFFLRMIAIANLLYCFLTANVILLLNSELTTLGIIYFILEIIIIVTLVLIELRKASI